MVHKALLVLAFSVASGFARADNAVTAAGVTVKVAGQSGKMTMIVPAGQGTQEVEVKMEALRELDAQGVTLGSGGSAKHSFNSFATQDFFIADPVDSTYAGLSVSSITFDATLVGTSKLKVQTLVFKQAGSFKVGDDVINVAVGTVKFNVEMSSWTWCGGAEKCTNNDGTGASVELDISVQTKGLSTPAKVAGKGNVFALGGNLELMMLNTYSVDGGAVQPMPEGFPLTNGAMFTLKFPRWTGTLVYDPIVTSVTSSAQGRCLAGLLLPTMVIATLWFTV